MTTKQLLRIEIVPLTAAMTEEVADLYARVFAGPPFFEIKRCSNPECNEAYGEGDDLQRFHNGDACRRCGRPLTLVDYWRGQPAIDVYSDALARPGFVGMAARDNSGRLVAFSWGFAVPETDTPSVQFGAVSSMLRAAGIDLAKTFYAAETGVDPECQHLGVGGQVSFARLSKARDAGFVTMCTRTKNEKLLQLLRRLFGDDNVHALFNDPEPAKSDRVWYACPMTSLRAIGPSQQEIPTAASRALTADAAAKRFEEYRLIIEDISRSSERGQGTNDVYIALNGLFLTALGALVLTSSLRSWWIAGAFASVTLLSLCINGFWLRAILLRRRVQRIQIAYAVGVETLLRETGNLGEIRIGGELVPFGIFSLLQTKVYRRNVTHGRTRIELQLAAVITATYPIATAVVAALTYMVANGYLPPLSIR